MDGQEQGNFFTMAELLRDKKKMAAVLVFFALIALFWITRLWKLTELPFGMHVDEAGMAYSSWCLAEYGVDRYLNPWPVYIPNFYGAQSALYIYLCVILFKLFGYHLALVRLPAVLFSFLTLIFGMLTVRKIFSENNILPFIAGGWMVVCPYFIMAGRFGLDCNLMLGMSTIFLYCFICAIESGKISRYILAGVTGGLVLYTYAISYLALPVFLVLAFFYLIRVKRFSLKGWIAMAIPMGILAFPLILVQIVTIFDLESFRIGCFTIPKIETNRVKEIGAFSFTKLYNALGAALIGDDYNYNSAPGYENIYGIIIILFMLGADFILKSFWKSIRDRKMDCQMIPLLWLISMLFLGAKTEANVNRMNGIFFVIIFVATVGMDGLCKAVKRHSTAIVVIVSVVCLLHFGKFANYYFGGTYTAENYMLPLFDVPVTEAAEFIEQDSVLSQKTTQMFEVGIYYTLGALKSPYDLDMREIETVKRHGNYIFGFLGGIEEQYNYIVADTFEEYSEQLRAAGFTEERYRGYSLFYKK